MLVLTEEQKNFLKNELKTLKLAEKQTLKVIETLEKFTLTTDQIINNLKVCSALEIVEITEKLTKEFKLENFALAPVASQQKQVPDEQEQEVTVAKKTILLKPYAGSTIPFIQLLKEVIIKNGGEQPEIVQINNLIKNGGELLKGVDAGKAEEIKKYLTSKGLEIEIKA